MPRDSAAADRPASYLVGTAAAFPLFFRDRTKPINQLPFSPSAKFPKSGSSCESRANTDWHHYTWTIVATDLDPKALQPGMTREELAAALKDHVKGSAGLVTRFRHPT